MAVLLLYAIVVFSFTVVIAIAYDASYWLDPFFIGAFFIGSAIIARQQQIGFSAPVRLVEMLTPGGLYSALRGSRKSTARMFPPRLDLVVEQLERDGWGPFLRRLDDAPSPNAMREPWKTG